MYIQQSDLLRGMSRDFVKEFIDIAIRELRDEGDFIFREGDRASYFYILLKGRIKLSVGGIGHVVYVVNHPGEVFGWSSLVGRDVYSASAECKAQTKLLRIEMEKLQKVLEKDPATGLIFFKRLARTIGNRLLQSYHMVSAASQAIPPGLGTGRDLGSTASP
nr:cyclic nucleotide-binding domain-containing protein [Desulfobacterales bacterium]